MSATLIVSILLGLAAFSTSVFGVITQARDRSRSVRRQEGDIDKIQAGIKLDETERERIAAEAAQINADQRIATERWWKEQFDAVKTELVEEQRLRRRLSIWASQHQEWDKRAWTLALEADPTYPPPPTLEPDD
jgi:hypothetical protein